MELVASRALRPVWRYAAALFLSCGVLLGALLAPLLHELPASLAGPALGVGTLLSLTWLGIGTACAVLACSSVAGARPPTPKHAPFPGSGKGGVERGDAWRASGAAGTP